MSRFPAAGRAELFADGPVSLAPAPLAPTGTVTEADGGLVLNGRWEWATGVEHSDWVLVHAVQAEPEFTTLFLVVPRSEVVVEDVWFTSGMRATGSNRVRIEDCFVPSRRATAATDLLFGAEPLEGDGLARPESRWHEPPPSGRLPAAQGKVPVTGGAHRFAGARTLEFQRSSAGAPALRPRLGSKTVRSTVCRSRTTSSCGRK